MKNRLRKTLLELPGFEAACRRLTRRHVRAIMYHTFTAGEDDPGSALPGKTLAAQLDLIRRHHSVVSPDDHLAALARPLPVDCPVVITVDDGYADFHEIAFPLLREFKIPATLFVATGFVAGKTWFWWDRLAYIIDQAGAAQATITVGHDRMELDFSSPAERRRAWNQLADACRFLPDSAKEAAIAELATTTGVAVPDAPPRGKNAVTWAQLVEMEQAGIQIGAHTVNHPILSRVDLAEARLEILTSRDQLADKLGHPVTWFCYPQGGPADTTAEVREIVRDNFDGSYLAYQEMTAEPDRAALPRYVASRNLHEFRWMLCGAEYLFLRLKKFLGKPTGVGQEYWQGSQYQEST